MNAWHKLNRWLQTPIEKSCGVFSWHTSHTYFSKVYIYAKKHSAKKIKRTHYWKWPSQVTNQSSIILVFNINGRTTNHRNFFFTRSYPDHIDLLPTNSRTYTNVPIAETQYLIYMDFTLSCAICLCIIFSHFNFHGYFSLSNYWLNYRFFWKTRMDSVRIF